MKAQEEKTTPRSDSYVGHGDSYRSLPRMDSMYDASEVSSFEGTGTVTPSFVSRSSSTEDLSYNGPLSPTGRAGSMIRIDSSNWSGYRRLTYKIIEHKYFSSGILTVILLNTAMIAMQTNKAISNEIGWYLSVFDNLFLGIYIFELVVKLYVWRKSFFYTGWNNFDLVIVVTSFFDWIQFALGAVAGGLNPKIFRLLRVFRAIRALRALRALRAITFLQHLQMIVSSILRSIPAITSIVALLFLVLYTFALIGRESYGTILPERFGRLDLAMMTLFQIISLDDWSLTYEAIRASEPSSVAYFVVYIILETFVFINLFVAVLVNNLEQSFEQNAHNKRKRRLAKKNAMYRKIPDADTELQPRQSTASVSPAPRSFVDTPRSIDHFYNGDNLSLREKQLMAYYFMLLAAVENNADSYQTQMKLVNELVDLSDEKQDEESKERDDPDR